MACGTCSTHACRPDRLTLMDRQLSIDVKACARGLGFDLVGITTADPLPEDGARRDAAADCGTGLVTAMCLRHVAGAPVSRARSGGPGTRVLLFAPAPGRDGIAAASALSSHHVRDGEHDKRRSVNMDDPFTG